MIANLIETAIDTGIETTEPFGIEKYQKHVAIRQGYLDNLKFLLEQCKLAMPAVADSVNCAEIQDGLSQCISWLHGEIKELENL